MCRQPGKVWFTIEVLVDDGKNRYSLMKSAATIGIISVGPSEAKLLVWEREVDDVLGCGFLVGSWR